MIDGLAKRYHCTPSDVLDWDPWEFGVNFATYKQAAASAAQRIKQIQQQPSGLVVPAVVVWEGGL